ncbi:MAG: hypothetical protein C0609_11465 [Deltaproteobacteria bacterium]|nr:MAG: hypothetical protein C0609_11465 [Deltaproteobacteria bacterium]
MAAQNNEDSTTFDIGSADEIATCTSCHMGGGPYEVDRNGNRYDEFYAANKDAIAAGEFGNLSGDYFRYDLDSIASAPLNFYMDAMSGGQMPSPSLSGPRMHDWEDSGVMEAECLMCHVDPLFGRLTTADGVKVQSYSPMLQSFLIAKWNADTSDYDDIYAISFGRYPTEAEVAEAGAGYKVYSPSRYSKPLSGEYVEGLFYSSLDAPSPATRDAVRMPTVEGGRPMAQEGQNGFTMHNGYSPFDQKTNHVTVGSDFVWASRKFLGYHFRESASAGMMGLDLDGDGIPLAYVKLVKKPGVTLAQVPSEVQNYFDAEIYYDPQDLALFADAQGSKAPILASDDTGGHKWDLVCGRCHVGFVDPVNDGVYIRPAHMGMKADVPKRGTWWKMDYEGMEDYEQLLADIAALKKAPSELAGYDVHASKGVECVDCHAKKDGTATNANHNFGKGIDTGGTVRNDLDYTRIKVCVDCHDKDAMVLAHRENFDGEANVIDHFEHVACETCHVPQKSYWSFRAFDYSLGIAYNFNSRYMPNPGDPGNIDDMKPFSDFYDFGIMDPQPGYYAAAPLYGVGGLQWAGQSNPLYGMDVVTSIAYFDPSGPDALTAMRSIINDNVFPEYFNPMKPMDPYAMFYTMMTDMDGYTDTTMGPEAFVATANGQSYFNMTPVLYKKPDQDGKIKLFPGNPVTILTWADFDEEGKVDKVLYFREMNSIIAGATSREVMNGAHQMGLILINEEIIWDDNFDLRPEISNETELDAVRQALETVLAREDELAGKPGTIHDLRLTMVAHYFTITHNILPASQALGAPKDYDYLGGMSNNGEPTNVGKVRQCVDCHVNVVGFDQERNMPIIEMDKPGDPDVAFNARLSTRRVVFLPWAIEDFNNLVTAGKIYVEDEIASYVHPIDANANGSTDDVSPDFSNVSPNPGSFVIPGDFIGSTQMEIVEHTEEAAHAFAHLAGMEPIQPGETPEGEEPEAKPVTGSTGCFIDALCQ